MFLISSCSCLCPVHCSQVLSREWRCSWSSAYRRCSTTSEWSTNLSATKVAYIRGFTVYPHLTKISELLSIKNHNITYTRSIHNAEGRLWWILVLCPAKMKRILDRVSSRKVCWPPLTSADAGWTQRSRCGSSGRDHMPKKKNVSVSYQLTSFSFHINQTNNSWDRAISKFDLEASKVKVMSEVKGQGHISYPVSNRCISFSFHINPTNHSWDMAKIVFDLEKIHPKFLRNLPK